jgi:hypothetical protein
VNLLCPACRTPLPAAAATPVLTCPLCAAEVDVSRAGTAAGRPRFVPDVDRRGTQVGEFHVEALLGGGGMGTVYRAVDGAGQAVALKFLSSALGDAPDLVARFAREIEALSRLQHPAIVRVLAHGRADTSPWFAMELVTGPDLKTRLGEGPMDPDETAAIFARLFAALAHAHARGVVHRDLKPANVLLSPSGAKLADFGIAHFDADALTGARAVTRLTETAAVLGSLPYMSPEQRRGGSIDGRSDLFSAGVMLYEAATGTLPQGAFAPPSALNPRYSKAFDALVLRLLNPEPARRPASADEAARTLATATRPRRFRFHRFNRFASRATLAAALTLLVLSGTLGGWALLRRGGDRRLKSEDDAAAKRVMTAQRQAPPPAEEPGAPNAGLAALVTPDAAAAPDGAASNLAADGIARKTGLDENAFVPPPGWDNQGKTTAKSKAFGKRSGKVRVMDYDLKLTAEVAKANSKTTAKTKAAPKAPGSSPSKPRLFPMK